MISNLVYPVRKREFLALRTLIRTEIAHGRKSTFKRLTPQGFCTYNISISITNFSSFHSIDIKQSTEYETDYVTFTSTYFILGILF